MAKQIQTQIKTNTKVSRKGVHAKTKSSTSKGSSLYKKPYKGQGK